MEINVMNLIGQVMGCSTIRRSHALGIKVDSLPNDVATRAMTTLRKKRSIFLCLGFFRGGRFDSCYDEDRRLLWSNGASGLGVLNIGYVLHVWHMFQCMRKKAASASDYESPSMRRDQRLSQ